MPRIADLSLALRATLTLYPWRRIEPVPCASLAKAPADSRVGIVSTAGLVPAGGIPFDPDRRGGDASFRVIPDGADVRTFADAHRSRSFDHSGIAQDRNLAFPLDRLREMAAGREIAAVAPRHLMFMGSITAPGRLIRESAPAAAALFVEDQVDVALLFPV